MTWEMKGNAVAGTDLIKIWSLSERKGREKNDSFDSNIISKLEARMRNLEQVGEGVCKVCDVRHAQRVHRPSGQYGG